MRYLYCIYESVICLWESQENHLDKVTLKKQLGQKLLYLLNLQLFNFYIKAVQGNSTEKIS